jgi:hypothetical protein
MSDHIRQLPLVMIKRFIRRMRGGSQAHLVEGSDGRFYVAKFLGNPQGNRTLVNEVLASQLLAALDIDTPPLCRLSLTQTQESEEHLYFETGDKHVPIKAGEHLGSMCPVNPNMVALFDFLPTRVFDRVFNLRDFATIFVIDRWLSNVDNRQAIFFRNRGGRYKACFIDHGRCFSGQAWKFLDIAVPPQLPLRQIFERLDLAALTREAIEQIEAIDPKSIANLVRRVPAEWMSATDWKAVVPLLDELDKRRSHLKPLVTQHLDRLQSAPKKSPMAETSGSSAFVCAS